MRNPIAIPALPIAPALMPLQGAGARLLANREPQSVSGTIPDDFLSALGNAGAPNSLKINVSALSALKTTQSASGSAATVPGMKHHVAAVTASATIGKDAMAQKDGTSGTAQPASEAATQAPAVQRATPPDPAAPRAGTFDIAAEPVAVATSPSPSPSPEVKPSASHPDHAKSAVRQDADAYPSAAGQATGLTPDPTMAAPAPAVVPELRANAALAVTSSGPDTSPHLQVPSRSQAEGRGSARLQSADDMTTSAAGTAGADAAFAVAGVPGAPAMLPRSVGAPSHEPRQVNVQATPAAASASATPGAAPPALPHTDNASSRHLLSMTVPAHAEASPATVVPMAAVVPQPDPLTLPGGAAVITAGPLELQARSSVQLATPQVATAVISLATHTDGSHEMTVSLNPRDLGQVEVHLVRNGDGTTAVTVTASRADVLQELSRNAHHLHAALDAAEIPAGGRVMNFVAAAAASDQARNDPGGRDSATGQDSATSQDGSGSRASAGEDPGQGSGQGRAGQQHQPRRSAWDANDDNGAYRSMAAAASRNWQLSGLNITA